MICDKMNEKLQLNKLYPKRYFEYVIYVLYHQQQIKWYPQGCLLAYFEATMDFT